ncbi:hypothetical protein [Pannonibacter phragmitetus]|uniref:hypothetical protein n=1 Tax=Pannonibacter phragmitetus TaxID=121719 RepID=UPI003D2ED9BB
MTDVETGAGVEPKAETASPQPDSQSGIQAGVQPSGQSAVQSGTESAGQIPAVPAPQVDLPKVTAPEVNVPEVKVPVMTPPSSPPSGADAGNARGEGRDGGRGDGRGAGRGGEEAAASGSSGQPEGAATGEFVRDLAGSSGDGKGTGSGGATGAQLLRQLLIEHLKVAALQSGYAQVTQALPKVLAAGIEAGQRKKAADQAYEEGLAVAVKVLTSARDAAKNLSSSIQGEQETLAKLLSNNEELVKLPPDAVKALSVMEQIGHNLATQKAGLSNPTVKQGLQYQIEQMKQHLAGASR